jgi:predicted TIM-barrel fold metal-dependent hydrolase
MIVDCHTHVWESPEQLGHGAVAGMARLPGGRWRTDVPQLDASTGHHLAASSPVDMTFVLAFKSRYLKAEIPNQLIADYCREHPGKMIGFAGVDPSGHREALGDLQHARQELGLRGLTVSPAAQDFHPQATGAMQVFAEAASLRMPVLFHQGTHFTVASKMEYARPVLLDEVARELPSLRIIIAHMGYPWVDECVVLLGKHPNVFADVSGLLSRPWQAYNALLSAHQFGVMDKLLFGSDFPYTSAAAGIEALYSINQFAHGTNLPTIPRQHLRNIVERDALELLGIESAGAASQRPASSVFEDDEV